MTAVDIQQLTLGRALVCYRKYLETLREQQENNLFRNGKAPATATDLSIDRAFDEQLQAIASLLASTEESPEQTIRQIKRPPGRPPAKGQAAKPTIWDELDSKPYINPFTGQLVIPDTPFTAGPSNSHINAQASAQARPKRQIVDRTQQQQTNAVPQSSSTSNPSIRAAENYSASCGARRPRPSQYKSAELSSPFDTRNAIPAARSYVSESGLSEEARLLKPRWGTISRIRYMGSKASPSKASSEKRTRRPQDGAVGSASHKFHSVAIAEPSPLDLTATKTVNLDARQSLRQHHQAKCSYSNSSGGQRLLQNTESFSRRETLSPNRKIGASKSLAPSIVEPQAPRTISDISTVTQLKSGQRPSTTLTQSFRDSEVPEISLKNPTPPRQPPRISPVQSNPTVLVHQQANQPLQGGGRSSNTSTSVALELANTPLPLQPSPGRAEDRAGKTSEFSSRVPALALDEASWKLALELSGGFPQDYASLKQIQEEQEMCAQLLQSQSLAKELAGPLPQGYAAAGRLGTEHGNVLEKLRLAEMEWETTFEADRKLAQSLAAEDVPQEIRDFSRVDQQRQLEFEEEARVAKEIAEQEDRTEIQAQLELARRAQAEWKEIVEQQRVAQELAENEDRLELQRLQAELEGEKPTRTTTIPPDADPQLAGYPPTDTSPNKLDRKQSGPRPGAPSFPSRQQTSTDTSGHRDAKELTSLIAQRRARRSQWQAEVQNANKAAKQAEEAVRRRAREDEEEMRRLEQQRALAEKFRREKEAIEAERRARQAECTVCSDTVEKSDMAVLSCKHAYCGGCIAQAFQHALTGKKPFTCCRSRVPVHTVARFLPNDFVSSYQTLVLELATPNPTYCSNASCSAFIPPPNIKGDIATCPRCSTNTCKACRSREHPGVICAQDVNGQKLLNLATAKKWQQCPHCKTLMEKRSGCLHMTCTCGTESCYNCGGIWSNCGGVCSR